MEIRCAYSVGPGYASSWGIQNNDGNGNGNGIRCRRRTSEVPLAVNGNRKYLKGGAWMDQAEMKRKRRLAKYKSYETEKSVKTCLRRGLRWLKNKCGRMDEP